MTWVFILLFCAAVAFGIAVLIVALLQRPIDANLKASIYQEAYTEVKVFSNKLLNYLETQVSNGNINETDLQEFNDYAEEMFKSQNESFKNA